MPRSRTFCSRTGSWLLAIGKGQDETTNRSCLSSSFHSAGILVGADDVAESVATQGSRSFDTNGLCRLLREREAVWLLSSSFASTSASLLPVSVSSVLHGCNGAFNAHGPTRSDRASRRTVSMAQGATELWSARVIARPLWCALSSVSAGKCDGKYRITSLSRRRESDPGVAHHGIHHGIHHIEVTRFRRIGSK